MPIEVAGVIDPAFIAALAALVTSVAALIKVLPIRRGIERIEKNTNGNIAALEERNRELRDKLDEANTAMAQQRRTIEVLLERERRNP